jgi:hypothetical protein
VWSDQSDIGGDILVITQKDKPPLVTAGNLRVSEQAALNKQTSSRVPRIFNWRSPRGF